MFHRNQYGVGVISGILICMSILGLLQINSTPRITGYYQTDLKDVQQLHREETTLHIQVVKQSAPKPKSLEKENTTTTTQREEVITEQTTEYTTSDWTTEDTTSQSAETTTARKATSQPADTTTSQSVTATQPSKETKKYPPLPAIDGLLPLVSENQQVDDKSVAEMLYTKVRVLCWVMTSPSGLNEKAIHSYHTWGHRCNKVIFISTEENSTFPAPVIKVNTIEGRDHLTAKTMLAFKYIYDHYYNDYEWFMKADDDTFVIVENLRYFLSDRNPREPVYYGHHFKAFVQPQGYFGGGGGYVISKEALSRFAQIGYPSMTKCPKDFGAEDVEFGKCMQNIGVRTGESYDERGRSRFHGLNLGLHLDGAYPDWYYQMDSHGGKHGAESISNYPISFHYVTPQAMKEFAFFIYHLKVYGIQERSRPKLNSYYTTFVP